jgi:hypothetical protein
MNEQKRTALVDKLKTQLADVEGLRLLAFTNPTYGVWRVETGELLDQLFGRIESAPHPCTQAFLNYKIPELFSAGREEMQEYYLNILQAQADLLSMCLEDVQLSDSN